MNHWKNDYNWREQEAKLNEMPQYKVKIDDLDIHFVHMVSPHPKAKPLMLIHGWPGSFWECSKGTTRLIET